VPVLIERGKIDKYFVAGGAKQIFCAGGAKALILLDKYYIPWAAALSTLELSYTLLQIYIERYFSLRRGDQVYFGGGLVLANYVSFGEKVDEPHKSLLP
jgi:hypothetical protein